MKKLMGLFVIMTILNLAHANDSSDVVIVKSKCYPVHDKVTEEPLYKCNMIVELEGDYYTLIKDFKLPVMEGDILLLTDKDS